MSVNLTIGQNTYRDAEEIEVGGLTIGISEDGVIPTPTETISIVENGTVDVSEYAYADVDIPSPTGIKNISITQNGTTIEDVTNYASTVISVNVSGSGGGNTPVASGNVVITVASGKGTFEITLSKAITKGIVEIKPDATTLAAIEADTSTTYYLAYALAMYPQTDLAAGTTYIMNGEVVAYRGSVPAFYTRPSSITGFILTLDGTTLTVSISTGLANYFPSGTYKVNVWELADAS